MNKAAFSCWWSYWVPPVAFAAAIVALSGGLGTLTNTFVIFKWVVSWFATLDPKTLEMPHFYFRKFLHFTCYGLLSFLWFRALMATFPRRRPGLNALAALGLSLLVAFTDEGHQYLVPGRTPSLWDIGLDMTGGVFFLLMATCCRPKKNHLPGESQPPPPCRPGPGPS